MSHYLKLLLDTIFEPDRVSPSKVFDGFRSDPAAIPSSVRLVLAQEELNEDNATKGDEPRESGEVEPKRSPRAWKSGGSILAEL